LRAFLGASHKDAPGVPLTSEETGDVVAYILGLKGWRPPCEEPASIVAPRKGRLSRPANGPPREGGPSWHLARLRLS
jgi:hypothetical protein